MRENVSTWVLHALLIRSTASNVRHGSAITEIVNRFTSSSHTLFSILHDEFALVVVLMSNRM
ncbi:hypothetical protein EDE15_4245 [Edaphobacter aggregans]|uniref:Uncharacterized protein n=1 Tax=Edaphobacter aggregans TaxID=570835 RepID=A0A3R9P138_9BACT|nr:hypothetical protein EDE15_4245 [Edaphobacter aggregans]